VKIQRLAGKSLEGFELSFNYLSLKDLFSCICIKIKSKSFVTDPDPTTNTIIMSHFSLEHTNIQEDLPQRDTIAYLLRVTFESSLPSCVPHKHNLRKEAEMVTVHATAKLILSPKSKSKASLLPDLSSKTRPCYIFS
jgi:hypothetical protein